MPRAPVRHPAVGAALMWLAATLAATPAAAQTGRELLSRAYDAYQRVDLSTTVGLIQRALGQKGDGTISRGDRLHALTVLGAAQLLREQRDSAASAFRQAVLLDPRYQPDALVHPPPVHELFRAVRQETKVVALAPPDSASFPLTGGAYMVPAFASSSHEVAATIARADGRVIQRLYHGPIGDSLELRWNARDSVGVPVSSGSYVLRVASEDGEGRPTRVAQATLTVSVVWPDTLAHPVRPDAELKPERRPFGPALRALLAAGGIAVSALAMPAALGDSDPATETRLVVSGALGIAGIVGFLAHQPGRVIPENVEANRRVLEPWEAERRRVVQANQSLLDKVRVVVWAAPPVRIDRESE